MHINVDSIASVIIIYWLLIFIFMYITQKKRAVYDRSGALYKIDFLRSVRRNDAPQSNLRSIEEQNQLSVKIEEASSKWKLLAEYALIAIMLLCCYLLVGRLLIGNALSLSPELTSFPTQQKNTSFSSFQSNPLFHSSNKDQFRTAFLQRSQCSIVQGKIFRCEMTLQSISNNINQ